MNAQATNANSMLKDACEFIECVKHKQHKCWVVFLIWWICIAFFVLAVSELFKNVPPPVLMVVFYGSAFLLYLPGISLYRLKCPYCQGAAGALPFFRYKFLYCRACGKRIECNQLK